MAIQALDQVSDQAPTGEIGAVLQSGLRAMGRNQAWSDLMDEFEYVPEITWPNSVALYDQMRSDTQLIALYNATILTVENWKWSIEPNGADDAHVQKMSKDYNLPILGDDPAPRGRHKNRFAFQQHQHKAFRSLIYGHGYFEQVGSIGDDGLWHVRKLAERPQRLISGIKVASDGGLVSITQSIVNAAGRQPVPWGQLPEIPVDRLLAYIWEQEGGNWFGRSFFRECYKNWLIKDRLMRIDAINHEKAGGVPIGIAAPGSTPSDVANIAKLASDFKVGEHSGGGLPAGADLKIMQASGTNVVDSMRYHDESMARRFLLMVMQLGQTRTGSRNLGTTFVDFFARGLESVGIWYCDTFNEHMIEDDIDWNYGEDVEFVPKLHFEHDPELDVTALATMIENDVIRVDDDLEDAVRHELGVTKRKPPREPRAVPPGVAADPNPNSNPTANASAELPGRRVTAGGAPSPFPGTPLPAA